MAKRKAVPAEGRRFEEKVKQLEGIVARLEGGEVPLEESLELFTQGTGLLRELASTLEEAERKVEVLSRDAAGKLSLTPLPEDETEEEG